MKRTLLPLAAFATVMSGAAIAADIPVMVPPAPPVVVTPPPAPTGGPYVSVFGGALFIFQDVLAELPTPFPEVAGFQIDRGYRFGAAIGIRFNEMLGAEVEVARARAQVSAISFDGVNFTDISDEELFGTLWTVMGNVNVGFDVGRLRPYVAVGAGAANLSLMVPTTLYPPGIDDRDWTWAAQALAGVDFAITENISIGARYRFQRVGMTTFEDGNADTVTVLPFNNHGIEAVFTIGF